MKNIIEYYTSIDLVKVFGVCYSTLINWDLEKKFVAMRHPVSKRRIYTRSQIEEFLKYINEQLDKL